MTRKPPAMRELSLFSGAGGGLLATKHLLGWESVGYVEFNEYCQKVLQARIADGLLDDAPIIKDVRSLTKEMVDSLASLWHNSSKILEENDMGAPRKDYDEAVSLYNAGLSVGDVAAFYNISRQAMHAILKRREVQFRTQAKFGEDNHFFRGGDKASDKTQNILEKALEKGIVIRPDSCESCTSKPTFKDGRTGIQGHHPDYNKPLLVMWLCQKCHHEWHKSNRAVPRKEEETVEASDVIDVVSAGFP